MKDWFTGLDQREQKIVMAVGIVAVIAVFYLAIWTPLDNAHRQSAARVDQWQTALNALTPLKGRMGGNGQAQISPSNINQPLVVVIDSTLRLRQLNSALKSSQPSGDSIRVDFENVAFDDLVQWLGDLSSQYALFVQSGTFSQPSADAVGRVNAQLTLGR